MRRRTEGMAVRPTEAQTLDAACCVAEVMATELFTLTPDTVVGSALRLAAAKRIQHFLVIEDGNLAGIVCQNDLRGARQPSLVGECMSSPVLCVGPETTVAEASQIMGQNSIACLPVVTGAFLVGVITRDKLTRMGVPPEATQEEEPESRICDACGGSNQVRRDLRAGAMCLCVDCAAVIPASDVPRGN